MNTGSNEPVWVDREAGPVVRPYAVTSGRTRPVRGAFDLFSTVVALHAPVSGMALNGPQPVRRGLSWRR